jgi:nuclear pore complex protein Nup133
LVVVMPKTGKITYWESIASAATLDIIRPQRNGVEASIPDISSKETVVQLLNAESAGFILAFSTGKLAYMSVRDGQGRPAITIQTLRGSGGVASGGFFGSLRSALIAPSLGEIAAIRAGQSTKVGERDVVVATCKGKLQAWEMQRSGHNSLQAEADAREHIVLAMKQTKPDLEDLLLESFEMIDFTFTPHSLKGSQLVENPADSNLVHLLTLVSLTDRTRSHYALVEVILGADTLQIGGVRMLSSYTTPTSRLSTSKPRIHLPNPGLVAFVVFDRAVVIASMARQPDSPEMQLMSDSHLLPKVYEDVIDFRAGLDVEIVGSGSEEPPSAGHGSDDPKSRRYKAKAPAAVIFVKGAGIIRIAAQDVEKFASRKAPQVTAKSKLEQAVFYGTIPQNLLSFVGRPELEFSPEEIGKAALELSYEILSCSTPHIASVTASVDKSLQKRSTAVRDLALHLKRINVALDRVTRWRLLWDAEKVAGASRVWSSYNNQLKTKPPGSKRGLLNDVIEYIHEDYKTEPVEEDGDLDRVRHWFINDVPRLDIAVPWAHQVVKYTHQEGIQDPHGLMTLVSEADDLVLGALEGGYDFRAASLELYGLENEVLERAILQGNYEGLPEPWTATPFITQNLLKQVNLAREAVKKFRGDAGKEGQASLNLVQKVAHENVRLVDLCCRSTQERSIWLLAQEDPQEQAEGAKLRDDHFHVRGEIIQRLSDLDLTTEAIVLAEKHRAMATLVELCGIEHDRVFVALHDPTISDERKQQLEAEDAAQRVRAKTYYRRFGRGWAVATYKHYIKAGTWSGLMDEDKENQHYLTNFLRSRPEFSKIAWINEVVEEKDFDRASQALLSEGINRERDNWAKKVELSIGKLARLAGKKYSQSNGLIIPDGGQLELKAANEQLELCKIEDQLLELVIPACTGAIDEKAELQLALEVLGNKNLAGTKVLSSLLEQNMSRLLKRQVLNAHSLIDLLTLIGRNDKPEEYDEIQGQEFYLALKTLKLGGLDLDEQRLVERVIWRRCLIHDNWATLNDTAGKDDQEAQSLLERTALYSTLRACYKNRKFTRPCIID